jgi:acyl-CoA thioesterase I
MSPYTTLVILGALAVSASLSAADAPDFIKRLAAGQKQHVIVYGTSLTQSGAWPGLFKEVLDKKFPKLVTLTNSAQSGMCSQFGVENLDKRVIEKKPDALFIEFAVNDAHEKFKLSVDGARKNLEAMIERTQKAHPQCEIILLTMNPVTGQNGKNRLNKTDDYYQMYRDVAKERKLRLVDIHQKWKVILAKSEADFLKLAPDGLHPNKEGAEKVIVPALEEGLLGKK